MILDYPQNRLIPSFLLLRKIRVNERQSLLYINQSIEKASIPLCKNIIRNKRIEWFERSEQRIYFIIYTNRKFWLCWLDNFPICMLWNRPKSPAALRVRTQRYLTPFWQGTAEFLLFHVYNSVHSITTEMNPTRNMNRKRKHLLNRSQEYQLQYLLAKEESFQ